MAKLTELGPKAKASVDQQTQMEDFHADGLRRVESSTAICDRSIGDILRQANGLTADQIEAILQCQRERGLRFGEAAVFLGMLRNDDVVWALSQQFHYPYIAKEENLSTELVVAREPFSTKAEVFRTVRSQIVIQQQDLSENGRSVAVISPCQGDGKTYFAANLAIAFSQLGGRTLLIDANMRAPRMHTIFQTGNLGRAGLSGILAGRFADDAVVPISGLPNLFLLPAGPIPPNPLELSERPAFSMLLRELGSKFDRIVVDTPAAESGTDSAVIAAKCGSALTIVRSGAASLDATRELLKRVHLGRTNLAGVVLNHH